MGFPTKNLALAALAASMLPAALAAETVVARAGEGGGAFRQLSGAWVASTVSSGAPGLEAAIAAKQVDLSAGPGTASSAIFTINAPGPGTWFVDMAWPATANASDVSVTVISPAGPKPLLVDLVPATQQSRLADAWVRLDQVKLSEAAQVTVRLDGSTVLGGTDASAPALLAVDAVRLTSEDTAIKAPELVTDVTAGDPFAANAADAAAAVANQNMEADDPFAAADQISASSPFEAVTSDEVPLDDPFASVEEMASAEEVQDPFASVPGDVAESPFDATEREEGVIDDPFAAMPGEAQASPFEGAPAPQEEEVRDPFAPAPGEAVASPFETTTEQPQQPLRQTAPARGVPPEDDALPEDPFEDAMAFEPAPAPAGVIPSAAVLQQSLAQEPELVELNFYATLEEAIDEARRTDRRVLVLFSGESSRARTFERTLSRPEIAEQLDDFELVRLEYRDNRPLAHRYAVRDYPYIVVMNKWGYTEGHVIPTNDQSLLEQKLAPYIQTLF